MLTIAWDVDDVLNDLARAWLEQWWKPRHPECKLSYENLTENPPHRLLGVEFDEYQESLDSFRLSGRYAQMPPDRKVLQWFRDHGLLFRHMALTAVPRKAAHISAAWVFKHFGSWIRTFHFVPSPRSEDLSTSYESTKAQYLKWMGRVDIFIDDREEYIADAGEQGIFCHLRTRPWNSGGVDFEKILQSLTVFAR